MSTAVSEPPSAPDPVPIVYTLDEARQILKISRQKLSLMINRGEIGHYSVGTRRFVRASDILEYQERHQRLPATAS